MFIGKQAAGISDFYAFIQQPANAERTFERIDGEIVEKMPTFGYSSGVNARLTTLIGMYLLKHDIAHLTDAQGGYELDDQNTVVPDVGIILKSRQPELPRTEYVPIPPDFVIEVVSESDLKDPEKRIETKRKKYIAAGVPLIWYVFYERKEVEATRLGQRTQIYGIGDTLDGGDILPGLTIKVDDIFPA